MGNGVALVGTAVASPAVELAAGGSAAVPIVVIIAFPVFNYKADSGLRIKAAQN